jgi:hypothetical protein
MLRTQDRSRASSWVFAPLRRMSAVGHFFRFRPFRIGLTATSIECEKGAMCGRLRAVKGTD